MKAEKLSGRALGGALLERVKREVALLRHPPSLAVVVVGNRHDSLRYVAVKQRTAEACGIRFQLFRFPETVSEGRLHQELRHISGDDAFDGVLLQLPLPLHVCVRPALLCIHPGKDVDGLHPLNAGNLFLHSNPVYEEAVQKNSLTEKDGSLATHLLNEGRYFIPCTALAVRALLFSYLERKAAAVLVPSANPRDLHVVIINKSMVVGVPTAALLQRENNFMVTLCSRSNDLEAVKQVSRHADVLVTAIGIPRVVTADFVKPGAIVLDVAINEYPSFGGRTPSGRRRVCGDVDVASVREKAAAFTPVPGGIGPLTVAYLMRNTLKAGILAENGINLFPPDAFAREGAT
ncbi:methylenetetrahydrofolate dehydrogenase-like protein [Trypanosoma rangeli]|uniref:Methylenetetrahydrofolate dehydrogenase-like protein n=1 Tax=Trypanosoma rangeli TaxID=5698 RepID=A0A422NSL2_TRYRA|nr:methylenetetrahydrofolate dehydrogenase-like protein [Trypanosoma rangeli]RNF08446.1 methylenetetrahydrofolate dehydrogenase-like protein [Trypanosoma rangeli]|eukprot:RNF08446.1 methylenetetrahydrofolate dehydrogenase-like protein [Trypanosoma rangeli]